MMEGMGGGKVTTIIIIQSRAAHPHPGAISTSYHIVHLLGTDSRLQNTTNLDLKSFNKIRTLPSKFKLEIHTYRGNTYVDSL